MEKDEVKLTIDQVPPAVKATILKESGGAALDNIMKESEDGKTVYTAEFMVGKDKYEASIAADGTLIEKKMDQDKKEDGDDKEQEHEGK